MGKRRQSTSSIEGLRLAIDCLPVATREAMLRGVREHERIIAGAYTDEHGGVCPMLAAHRCGGRTKFLSFAKSWDRFARAGGRNKRVASEREVRILIGQLEGSLASVSGLELDRAIAEHHALAARSKQHALSERRERRALAARLRFASPGNSVPQGGAGSRGGREIASEADPRGEIRARRLRERVGGLSRTSARLKRSRLAART